MTGFINRDRELDVLNEQYRNTGASFVVVYGPRHS